MRKLITWGLVVPAIVYSVLSYAALNDVDKAMIWPKNILKNGGFEAGKASWSVSSGSITLVSSGSNLLTGKGSLTWDASAASVTLTTGAITIPNGLKGKNGVAACKILYTSGTPSHVLRAYDGSSDLGSVTISGAISLPTYSYSNFIFPSSGTVQLQLVSNADEPQIAIDDCFLGDAAEINLTNIAQAQFIGSAYFATTASCTFTRTSTTLGALSDTDCPGPTVESNPGPGTIQTTDANAPIVTVNNLPPGRYVAHFLSANIMSTNSTWSAASISDGTNQSGQRPINTNSSVNGSFHVAGRFEYTASGNRSFELFVGSSTGAVNLDNATGSNRMYFYLERFPLSSEQAYRPDAVPFLWQGYHDADCGWSLTSTTLASPAGDTSCTFSSYTGSNYGSLTSTWFGASSISPGIGMYVPTTGIYEVCANLALTGATTGAALNVGMITSSGVTLATQAYQQAASLINVIPLCGWYNASSIGSQTFNLRISGSSGSTTIGNNASIRAINWYVRNLSQNIAAPLLVNSVVSTYSGVSRSEWVNVNTVCSSTPCTITNQSGGISSISRASAGKYTVNFSPAFSGVPACNVTNTTAGSVLLIQSNSAVTTTSAFTFGSTTSGGVYTDAQFSVLCMGPQ